MILHTAKYITDYFRIMTVWAVHEAVRRPRSLLDPLQWWSMISEVVPSMLNGKLKVVHSDGRPMIPGRDYVFYFNTNTDVGPNPKPSADIEFKC